MKNLLATVVAAVTALCSPVLAVQSDLSPYLDSAQDIDPGIASAGGTLDILNMEVSDNGSDIIFKLSVNGNITGANDWGNFMIGLSTGTTANTNTGNGWARPIEVNSPIGGMDYWIGSWVNGGGGVQLWNYTPGVGTGGTGNNWSPIALTPTNFVLAPGVTSTITYTLNMGNLGLGANQTFYFDAFSSGSGGGDSAVDALANPNISITAWGQPYTSSRTNSGGLGLNSYTTVPEPSTYALLGMGALGLAGYVIRRRARK